MKTKIFLILLFVYGFTFLPSYGLPQQNPDDCETAIEAITEYVEFLKCVAETPNSDCIQGQTSPLAILSDCKEACDYLESIIQKENSEQIRCGLIRYLGWMGNAESVIFLKQMLNKEELSMNEKHHIIFAYCQIGKFSERQDIMDEAVRLTDAFCGAQQGLYADCANSDCSQLYYYMGGETALNFFFYCFENEETRLPAALKLALLGEYKKTFPVFAEAINSDNNNDIITALQGLKAIGTEEAYLLIKTQIKNENESIAKIAQKFCENYEKKGGKL